MSDSRFWDARSNQFIGDSVSQTIPFESNCSVDDTGKEDQRVNRLSPVSADIDQTVIPVFVVEHGADHDPAMRRCVRRMSGEDCFQKFSVGSGSHSTISLLMQSTTINRSGRRSLTSSPIGSQNSLVYTGWGIARYTSRPGSSSCSRIS